MRIGLREGVSFPPFEKPGIRMFAPRVVPPFWLARGRWRSAYNLQALLAGILLALVVLLLSSIVSVLWLCSMKDLPDVQVGRQELAQLGAKPRRDSVCPCSCVVERVEHLKQTWQLSLPAYWITDQREELSGIVVISRE